MIKFGEVSASEISTQTEKSDINNYSEIKAECAFSSEEAKEYWDNAFSTPEQVNEVAEDDILSSIYDVSQEDICIDIDIDDEITDALKPFSDAEYPDKSELIEKYYKSHGIVPMLLKKKLTKHDRHSDIAKEFEVWIQTGEYKDTDCVEEHGYTAMKLAETFRLLNGEGAYFMLIELREHPQAALSKLRKGIKLK